MSHNKMKKLNIFNPRKSRLPDPQASPTTDTLHRIVNAKEEARKKWEEEQEMFDRRRREHELKMVDIERAEVVRREEEIRRKNEDLDDKRRKNRLVQDAVTEQIKTLQAKLEEYKINHKEEEEQMEDTITGLEDKLIEVKSTLENRIRQLEAEAPPTAPMHDDFDASGSYPTLPAAQARSFISVLEGGRYLRTQSSLGSSPNTSSSRSDTPRTTDDQLDYDTSV